MRVLLTGGSGMVGRNILEHAAAADHKILAPSRADLDLSNARAVGDAIKEWAPELIVHAAGLVGGIQANMRDPVRYLVENLEMGKNVVLGARAANVTRLLNFGSSCMYPRQTTYPIHEEQILTSALEPTNEGYALAKISVAKLCEYISRDTAFAYKTLIPCNLYGRHDKFDPAVSHLLPAVIHKIHQAVEQDQPTVEIWGDGKARREFLYAGDLADCVWQAAARFETLPNIANVSVGEDFTIDEYYQAAAQVIGFEGAFVHNLDKPVGMQRKLVSVQKINDWGWRASTSLRSGLKLTYNFYRNLVNGGAPA